MRKYETVLIADPDLQDQTRTELFDKVRDIITREKGITLDFDEWGNKKLAYEIRKKTRGHYVCITYGGSGALVAELERNFRLTDQVLKFMTIVLSEDTTLEALEQEIKDAEAQKAEQEAAAAQAAAEAEQARAEKAQEDASEPADTEEKEAEPAAEKPAEEA